VDTKETGAVLWDNISAFVVNTTLVFWSQNIVFVRVEDFVNVSAQVFDCQMNIECRNEPV